MSEDEFNEEIMKKNVEFVITLNNEFVKTIKNLEKKIILNYVKWFQT